jgi:hypothetical protein
MAISLAEKVPAGLVVREVPAATYAVFACPVQTIGQTKRYIFDEWGPRSSFPIDNLAPIFEQYAPAADIVSPVRIHVPVKTAAEAVPRLQVCGEMSMNAVEAQKEDVPCDSENPLYDFGFGMTF